MERSERDNGGHFAALEIPEEFVLDIPDFFGRWYKT